MKSKPKEDPEGWAKASPIARVRSDAPPFFVVHGACDTLASPATARRFAARLAEVSSSPVLHAELPGAQHAFEMFPSVRSIHVVNAVERFLDYIYTGYLAARGEQPPLEGAVTKGEGA
jgi:acetyl esterase/lipase